MGGYMLRVVSLLLVLSSNIFAISFNDDFNDNDISDWESRCASGNWSVSNGVVHGNTNSSPAALAPVDGIYFYNSTVTVEASGVHAFGIISRLTDEDSGIIAYISPDANVAKIRLVQNGQLGVTLASLPASFPSGVTYSLSLECNQESLTFNITSVSTNQTWSLSATDPNPLPGVSGLLMGDESNAWWDWIEVDGTAFANAEITWLITDDQSLGDGDFALEPGETIDLDIQLTNSGDQPLTNAFGILQALNSELTVTQNYVSYGTISSGETQYGLSTFAVLAPLATPADEVYDMRLTLMADGGFQKQLLFSLPVGCGIETDVEEGQDDWTWESVGSGWADDWHVSSEKNYTTGGQYSFKCGSTGTGDYSNHHFASLSTPLFNLPLGSSLSFWMWIDAQTLDLPEALDGGIVQYRRIGDWIDLNPVSGYTHEITTGSTGPFPDGTEVFSGTEMWTQYSILLPDSLAGPGQVRFVFGSDDSGTREGWYLDDINLGMGTSTEKPDGASLFTSPLLAVSRNPFSSSVSFTCFTPGTENSCIEIFDINGRLVRSIEFTPQDAPQTLFWDGTDSSGTTIPSGVYLARLQGSNLPRVKLIKI
ncbi:hypothetical protein DRQ21_11680 [Candidatus Fermentibacteria bacterium]|nr:MAG: hypothetical protein DRQ21_11680 [Candidatus Fermentibacteria bacterium]